MKRLLLFCLLLFPLALPAAPAGDLVLIPAPADEASLAASGFQLHARLPLGWVGLLPPGAALPSGGRRLADYDAACGELFYLELAAPGEGAKLAGRVHLLDRQDAGALFQAGLDQLQALPPIRGEWTRLTLTPKPYNRPPGNPPRYSDDFSPYVPGMVDLVSQTLVTGYIQSLEDFVTRNTFTLQCDQAASWILNQFESFGLDAYLHSYNIGGVTKYNVVGEKLGTLYPDSVLFITAHYDATIGSPGSPEPVAPGADDNASGTACVIETARILSLYNFEKTIRFVAFSGEEQGLVGSFNYVDDLLAAQTAVGGSFNYDMVAVSSGSPPWGLQIRTNSDPVSMAMANKIDEAVNTFTPGFIDGIVMLSSSANSDHYPFWEAGWPATFCIHTANYPFYHTVNDLLVNCNPQYAANVVKAALAALADIAVPTDGGTPVSGAVYGVWSAAYNPYTVTDTLWVPADSTLILEPGVTVVFQGRYPFRVLQDATLKALGTEEAFITFTALDAEEGWGGLRFLYASDSSRLEYCRLLHGRVEGSGDEGRGGNLFLSHCSLAVDHCVLAHGRAEGGGAIACVGSSNPVITFCTLAGNEALIGSAFYLNSSSPTVRNSILWNEGNSEIFTLGGSPPDLAWCDVRGGWEGQGNLDADPLFVAPDLYNYRLQSEVGHYSSGFWIPDSASSPALDAADPAASYSLEPEPNGDRADLGAYGAISQASLSPQDPHYAFGPVTGQWSAPQNSPMYVISDLEVPPGQELSIGPGVEVVFQGRYRLTVSPGATLRALGDPGDSIVFRPADPAEPWRGIRFLQAGDSCRLEYCRLEDGMADSDHGGGIFCDDSSPALYSCTIAGCQANSGGGAYMTGASSPFFFQCRLEANQATSGGAVYVAENASVALEGCALVNNSATSGAAMTLWLSASALLRNTVLADNAAIGNAGGVYCMNAALEMENCTVANNTAGTAGGVYLLGASNAAITGSILWGNLPTPFGSTAAPPPQITYSDVQGGWSGEGNRDVYPSFSAGPLSPYLLSPASLCVDAGNPDPIYNDPEDPANPGLALWPARGAVRNDMGAFGGHGSQSWVGVDPAAAPPELPAAHALHEAHPNPFNPVTAIGFRLPAPGSVSLRVYDIAGREIATLVQGRRDAGDYRIVFDGTGLASGVYLVRMEAGDFVQTRKMVLLK
ncbi:MAG: M28 family peptidase [Candidatus Zixiibacteriota bacterium]|nr:MAG: M28 family peptidase [candidate division Zixibacteria bacterium]